MANTIEPIKITGLRDFQAALKAMDGETQKQLRVVLNDAAQAVVGGAQRRVPVRTGKTRKAIRAQSSQREAKVVGGTNKVPWYGWLDFGGSIIQHKSKRIVRRTHVPDGRYIYPAYFANADSIGKALEKSLVELARNAGFEVTDG